MRPTQLIATLLATTANSIAHEIKKLPPGPQWREVSRGHTPGCTLHWVVVTSGDASDSPQQVLFFDHNSPIGHRLPIRGRTSR